MTEKEFNALYQNKDFKRQFENICHSFFQSNREELSKLAIFNIEDLEQECLIDIWQSEPNKETSYYIKTAQNRLLDLVGKGGSRNEIIQIEPLDDNLAYGIST